MEKRETKINKAQNVVICLTFLQIIIEMTALLNTDTWSPIALILTLIIWIFIYFRFKAARYIMIVLNTLGLVYLLFIFKQIIEPFDHTSILALVFRAIDLVTLCFLISSKSLKEMMSVREPLSEELKNRKSCQVLQVFTVFILLVLVWAFINPIKYNFDVVGQIFVRYICEILTFILVFLACIDIRKPTIKKEIMIAAISGVVTGGISILYDRIEDHFISLSNIENFLWMD